MLESLLFVIVFESILRMSKLDVVDNLKSNQNELSSNLSSRVGTIDWMSEISFNDFHFLLGSYLLLIDLQQLVRVNHLWHDRVRYDLQRFYLSDTSFTWAKSFEDLSKRVGQILKDAPYLFVSNNLETSIENQAEDDEIEYDEADESEESDEDDGDEDVDSDGTVEEDTLQEFRQISLDSKVEEYEEKDDIQADQLPPGTEKVPEGEENEDMDEDDLYELFLRELDDTQEYSQRNVSFDPDFFCLENEEYRQDLYDLLSNPSRQLCFYLQYTSLSEFQSMNIRPWKVVFLLTRIHHLEGIHLHYLNHIDTVELYGDLSLFTLDGLTGIRVLRISHFLKLRTIGGNLTSLEEVRIRDCPELQNLIGLESVRKATLEEGLHSLRDINPIKNCVHLSRWNVGSIKGFNNLRSLSSHFNNFNNLVDEHELVSMSTKLQVLCLSGGNDEKLFIFQSFQSLRELTIQASKITNLKIVDTLPQPLRKITIINCTQFKSLEGFSRVQSVELRSLRGLRNLTGINAHLKSLIIYDCDIQDWTGVVGVEELTFDYCLRGYDINSDFVRIGEIVKKKLILRNSRNIERVIGVERIPILEFNTCIKLQHFFDLNNAKIIFDKMSIILYEGAVQQALCESGRYWQEDYGDKIVLFKKFL